MNASNPNDSQKKWAVVTGASEGIGRVFAKELAKRGFSILAVARNQERLESLMNELGTGHRYLILDLMKALDVEQLADAIQALQPRLLVNNAGFGLAGMFTAADMNQNQSMIDVNITALTRLSHAFLQKAQKGDALINVASIIGLLPYPAQPVYSASKAYVTFFTESLWEQFRPRGVYIQNLCPGATKTEFFKRARGKDQTHLLGQTPEQVVGTSLRSWDAGRGPTVISGMSNRFVWGLMKLMPRKVVVRVMGIVEK